MSYIRVVSIGQDTRFCGITGEKISRPEHGALSRTICPGVLPVAVQAVD